MSNRAAHHRGTCQACGHVQLLPSGALSIHGYTKRWGFFHGRCVGSHHQPFEISKDLIEGCIANAERDVANLLVTKHNLLARPATVNVRAWRHVYVGSTQAHDGKAGNQWRPGVITADERGQTTWTGDRSANEAIRNIPPIVETLYPHSEIAGQSTENRIIDTIKACNENYVWRVIDVDLTGLRTYINWQRERLKGWSVQPLLPLDSARKDHLNAAKNALVQAGCTRRSSGCHGTLHWFTANGRRLSRSATAALAELEQLREKGKA